MTCCKGLIAGLIAAHLCVSGCVPSRPTSGIITVSGIPFTYVREGNGPTAVAIGSGFLYPKMYSRDLRKHLDLLFVDSRYNVPSYQPVAGDLSALSIDTFADDLEAVRRELGIDRWALIGHSIHAQTAIAYARKYPEHSTKLVIISGLPYRSPDFEAIADKFFQTDAAPDRKAAFAQAQQNLEADLAVTPPTERMMVAYAHRAALYFADPGYDALSLVRGFGVSPAFDRLAEAVPAKEEVRKALETIKVPTLVLLGRLDYAIPYFTWQPLLEGLPNVTYRLLENDSHNPMTEAAERFDPILVGFLNQP